MTASRIARAVGFLVLLLITESRARAAVVLDFENAVTGLEFAGDTIGSTAGPFLVDGIPTTFTTRVIATGGSLSASSFGLGVASGAGDPDPGSFNIRDAWSVSADQGLNFLGIDFGGLQVEETFVIQSPAWIGLEGITPASPEVSFSSPSGALTFTDLAPADTDIFDLNAMTGGSPLPLPAGLELTFILVGSTFGPNDDVELSSLTFAGIPDLFDLGDAPDPDYPTLLASDGARHKILHGYHLGASIDDEADGQPSMTAGGDGADEDGVVFTSPLQLNILPTQSTLEIIVSAAGKLDAWVDFNQDGDWLDPGEQVFAREPLTAGANTLVLAVPPEALLGCDTFARFRFSSIGGLQPAGMAADGEVEDYRVAILPDDDLDLFNRNISVDTVFVAADSISAGGEFVIFPDLSILGPAKVVFHAGDRVVLKNGVFVAEGAELIIKTEPVLTCP